MNTNRQREAAETLALDGLAHIAGAPGELEQFVAASGIDPQSLRERAGESTVLAAVLDFLLADDNRLLAFCEAQNLEPRDVHVARHVLDGSI